ncbi:MAG: DUF4177 domain-containing protein [Planctomycetota bacterium]
MPAARYEYDFVSIKLTSRSFSLSQEPAEDYQEVVRRRARDGWRLVQVFAPGLFASGRPQQFELIFERLVDAGADQSAAR